MRPEERNDSNVTSAKKLSIYRNAINHHVHKATKRDMSIRSKLCRALAVMRNCSLWMELDFQVELYMLLTLMHRSDIFSTVHIIWKSVELKVDTGAKCNIMAADLFAQVRQHEKLQSTQGTKLVAYGGGRNPHGWKGPTFVPLCRQNIHLAVTHSKTKRTTSAWPTRLSLLNHLEQRSSSHRHQRGNSFFTPDVYRVCGPL